VAECTVVRLARIELAASCSAVMRLSRGRRLVFGDGASVCDCAAWWRL